MKKHSARVAPLSACNSPVLTLTKVEGKRLPLRPVGGGRVQLGSPCRPGTGWAAWLRGEGLTASLGRGSAVQLRAACVGGLGSAGGCPTLPPEEWVREPLRSTPGSFLGSHQHIWQRLHLLSTFPASPASPWGACLQERRRDAKTNLYPQPPHHHPHSSPTSKHTRGVAHACSPLRRLLGPQMAPKPSGPPAQSPFRCVGMGLHW